MVYNGTKIILFGGFDLTNTLSDTWEWNGLTWTDVSDRPSARENASMAFNGTNIILFGGLTEEAISDTWRWDGRTWTKLALVLSPPARFSASMAYDGTNIILFGGFDGISRLSDTWQWDGSAWTELTPATSPPARENASMAYYGLNYDGPIIILFGGSRFGGERLGDTWKWDGLTWTKLESVLSPPIREKASMAYDGTNIILFGGSGSFNTILSDTWKWDGLTWTKLEPATSPPARDKASMASDGTNIILFGGSSSSISSGIGVSSFLSDTWKWNGLTWTDITPATSPSARDNASMAYDGVNIILFGGWNNQGRLSADTWRLIGRFPASPQDLTVISQSTPTSVNLDISWRPPRFYGENASITTYQVTVTANKSILTLPATQTNKTIKDVKHDTPYTVSVVAINSIGLSSNPAVANVKSGIPTNWNN